MGLAPLPGSFARTREALHRVAEEVVAPARKPRQRDRADPDARRLRHAAVRARRAAAPGPGRRRPRSSSTRTAPSAAQPIALARRGRRVRRRRAVPGRPARRCERRSRSTRRRRRARPSSTPSRARVLEACAPTMAPADEPSTINLWPEHFDIAFEAGPESARPARQLRRLPGRRATTREPYVYVGPVAGADGGRALERDRRSPAPSSATPSFVAAEDPDGARGRRSSPSAGRRSATDRMASDAPAGILAACDSECSPAAATVPGLNAVIRAIVRKGVGEYGHEFVGFRDGWRGPLEGDRRAARRSEVDAGILPRGGTILGSSRTNPFKEDGGPERIAANLERARRRRPDRDRRRGHARRREAAARRARASTSSGCRRRSTTTSAPPTTPSASTPRSTSR